MPRGIKTKRPKGEKNAHPDRDAYLRSGKTSPRICHVIASERHQPWLTLVVGSGCATSKSQEDALFQMADRLKTHRGTGGQLPGAIEGRPIGDAVALFARNLICDRLRIHDQSERPSSDTSQDVPEWLFELFTAAALSTKLYYRIKSLGFEAPRRPDRDDTALADDRSLSWGALDEEFVDPCRKVLAALTARVEAVVEFLTRGTPDDPETRKSLGETFAEILKKLTGDLNPPENANSVRITLTNLRALTEFAWFCFTKFTTPRVYPGWSDLLLDLSNYDPSSVGSGGTPLFENMTGAQNLIRSRYAEVTAESWRMICDQKRTQKERPYPAAAQLLLDQHRYRLSFVEASEFRPPLTTAFVTSFDLELELSLLALGEPFTMALPVHVLNPANGMAYTCWIALRVPQTADESCDGRIARLTNPGAECWTVLDEEALVEESLADAGPIVVRLAGCPLIPLPVKLAALPEGAHRFRDTLISRVETFLRIGASAGPAALSVLKNSLELRHAVVINEHDAILQSAIDLISVPATSGSGRRRGLPAAFAAGKGIWSRFWMMLGVQLHDSAVRQRISTLISSLPIPADQPDEEPAERTLDMEPGGVAVNKHLTPLEKNLLFWNGFDIVTGEVSAFAEDLRHYAAHLTPGELPTLFKDNTCTVS